MFQRVFQRLQASLFGGALIVSSSWILTKFLGLVKQRLIYTTFGPAGADSVIAAFAIPDLIYGTLILGSLLTAFMPVFMSIWQKNRDEAWQLSRSILYILTIIFFGLGLLLLLGADPIVKLLVGRHFDSSAQHTTTLLLRIMSMNMLLFSLSNVFAGVLQAFKHFVAVAVAPMVYNISIILGIWLLAPKFGAEGVAYGAVAGAALTLLIQFAAAWRQGWRPGPMLSLRHGDVREVGKLLLPRTIGQSVTQIDQFVNVPIATRLGSGELAMFRMANDIQDAPINIIGLSMATVAFPVFVELLSENKRQEFIDHFSRIVRQILFIIIPLTVLIVQLRAQIVRLFFGAPTVSWSVTIITAQTLGFFALSFFAQSIVPVLARSFYAMKDTKTPVRITMIAVVVDIIGSFILGKYMGVQGLALSYTISNILNATMLMVILHRRLGSLDEPRILQSTVRIIGITILMAVVVQFSKVVTVSLGFTLTRAYGVFAQAFFASMMAVMSYGIFAVMFRVEEASLLERGLRRFGFRKNQAV